VKFESNLASTMAQAIIAAIASGTAGYPKLQIYDGNKPSSIGAPITGNLLAQIQLTNQVGIEANGVISFDPMVDEPNAPAAGTPTWARLLDRDGNDVIHMTASGSGGAGEVQVTPSNINQGQSVSVSLGIIRVGD